MNQESIPTTRPTLEEVRNKFDQWRETRQRRESIPDSLWEETVRLSAEHSIHMISKVLWLNHTALKKRVYASLSENLPEPVTSPAFVKLNLRASIFPLIISTNKEM